MTKKSELSKIKKGDKLSMTYYLTVKDVDYSGESIDVEDQAGMEFSISGKKLIEDTINTANQFTQVINVSRTEIIDKLESAGDSVFSATFNKLPNETSLSEALGKMAVADLTDTKKLKKLAKEVMLGEERTIVGYLVSLEPKMGRSTVHDLEVPKGQHPLRQIDHRTISSLVIKNVKYVVK